MKKAEEEMERVSGFAKSLEKQLSNKNFVDRAPKEVIASTKEKLETQKQKLAELKKRTTELSKIKK